MNINTKVIQKIVVVLAAYDGLDYIDTQIDSILRQTGVDVTLFISVDLSSDGTHAWCLAFAESHPNVQVLPYGEHFGGAARNFFRLIRDVDFSSFDYVAFADQDDLWLSEKLDRAVAKILEANAHAYSSNVMAFWPNDAKRLIQKAQPQRAWDYLFEAAGPGCTYVMKKKLACAIQELVRSRWDEVQEVGLHDWFSYAFARAKGYRWLIDDFSGMLYRQHENNQVGVNAGWRAFVHRANKVLSGWGLAQSALISRLVGLNEDRFVVRWASGSRLGLLWLALNARQCRRRVRDQFIFAASCVLLSMTKRSRQ